MKRANFLISKQVSEYLCVPLRTIQRLTKEGKIKGVKIGKQWRYAKEDIERYLFLGTDFSKEPIRRPNEFVERRTYPRINANFECRYSIKLHPFKEIISNGIIKDISAGGVLVVCRDDGIEIGDPINLDFMDIKTEGRVVRKNRDGFGIKFRNINEEYRNKIIRYIG